MPEGISVVVEDGFATFDFVDPKLKGPTLTKLIATYGPEVIETLTRTGPRRLYRVPEGNAREVGLLDEGGAAVAPVVASVTYGDGKPDADWHRAALNAYAAALGIPSPSALPNKSAILKAIRDIEPA